MPQAQPDPFLHGEEVRYHMLRPDQVVARRNQCPAVYIPLGTLEWHGPHNALGADSLQAEGLAIACARKGGGLVFPPLYFGESRVEALMEANAGDRTEIARGMDLPPENFGLDFMPFTPREQQDNYHCLLQHILAQAQSLGFRVGVLIAGHYPLIDCAVAAVLHHNKRRWLGPKQARPPMLAWAFLDAQLVHEQYPTIAGDHAGGWETSHMMALHPQTVDLTTLPPKGQTVVGAGGRMDPRDSNAAFGREILEAAAVAAVHEVAHRLAEPGSYFGHGNSFRPAPKTHTAKVKG